MNLDGKTKVVSGQRFGKMIANQQSGPNVWIMDCDCGRQRSVKEFNLFLGRVTSCGCDGRAYDGDLKHHHGNSHHPLFKTWSSMINRCYNQKDPRYRGYGGRGITVAESWHSFGRFVLDMGERPDGTTLDREDNNAGYSKDNCRWLNSGLQQLNMRSNHILDWGGKSLPVSAWAKQLGINKSTLSKRISRGWTVDRALQTTA